MHRGLEPAIRSPERHEPLPHSYVVRRLGYRVLFSFLITTFIAAGFGSIWSPGLSQDAAHFDAVLNKPSWAPASSVFGPMWAVLYGLMAVAAWRIWRAPLSHSRTVALRWYWAQLALNVAWSPIFFGAHLVAWAAFECLVLLAAIVLTIGRFRSIDRVAALLMLPYFLWVAFAFALNVAICRLNA
jgi:benzodiazapine receptor